MLILGDRRPELVKPALNALQVTSAHAPWCRGPHDAEAPLCRSPQALSRVVLVSGIDAQHGETVRQRRQAAMER